MKKIALDTNVAIALLNGDKKAMAQISKYTLIYLPVTVIGELLFGAKNSGRPQENLKRFLLLIDACEELGINSFVAEEYSNVRLALKKKGNPIPENDIWIAAICKVNDVKLLTRDKHFSNIDNLKLAPM
jgi:tRNA(fMet)-specific endonuclease VapC